MPLRPAVIGRRITETEAVAALLAEIFTAGDDTAEHDTRAHTPGDVTGLDAAHGRLLAAVATRSTWSGAEFAALAAEQGLLPAGALDVINEAAVELTGQAAIEGDDLLSFDADVVREMLA